MFEVELPKMTRRRRARRDRRHLRRSSGSCTCACQRTSGTAPPLTTISSPVRVVATSSRDEAVPAAGRRRAHRGRPARRCPRAWSPCGRRRGCRWASAPERPRGAGQWICQRRRRGPALEARPASPSTGRARSSASARCRRRSPAPSGSGRTTGARASSRSRCRRRGTWTARARGRRSTGASGPSAG